MKSEKDKRPLVSVSILTYNHERFIAKAIESVLVQEVDFDYEIVIAEDCSTDRTREIVIEYAERYPELIHLILQEENQGINGNALRRACKGIYRAHLEGDDYWCDKTKLRRHVKFLQENPEFVGIGGGFECYDEEEHRTAFPWGKISSLYPCVEIYTQEHAQKWFLPAHASALTYRNVFYDMDEQLLNDYESAKVIGDRKLASFLVCIGPFYYDKRIVLHRRVLRKSGSSYTANWRKVKNQSGIAFSWYCEIEQLVKKSFNEEWDFSKRKETSWENSLKQWGKIPSKENLAVVTQIWKGSKHKAHYFGIATRMLKSKISMKRKTEGLGSIIKAFFVYPFKALKRASNANRDSKIQKDLETGKNFTEKNT